MPYSDYRLADMGSVRLATQGPFEAASFEALTIIYTAGRFGLDDLGSIRVAWRNCSDMGQPQFENPTALNYTTAEASNGAALECGLERGMRPFSKALTVTASSGYLSPGDTITVRLGDTRRGSPGIRIQSAVELDSEIAIAVDPFNTRDYALLPELLKFSVYPGQPKVWKAVLPTLRRVGQSFRLGLRADDEWGNPSDRWTGTIQLRPNRAIRNLPDRAKLERGQFTFVAEDLIVDEGGEVFVDILDDGGQWLATSNPMRIVAESELIPYWCDFHWQSRETVGVGTIRDGLEFARDKAFIDVTSHAANDLQLSVEQWRNLNKAFAEFDESGRFVVLPGYEWSGNTPVGGDRNVIFLHNGGTLRRSSHALVPDRSDANTDCPDARDLFEALANGSDEVLTFAHVGGRHCNIKHAHDPRIEMAIEVHSTYWGTFEWLIQDAFEMSYRVGFVCNSDDHKGRPGASCVGYAEWGNGGGLTCVLASELSRQGIWESLKRRHHYGTTGVRLHLDTSAVTGDGGVSDASPSGRPPIMGDIVQVNQDSAQFLAEVFAGTPIHRLEIRNGLELVETIFPYADGDLGDRIHVTFEGAEFRGRKPATTWDGKAHFSDARIRGATPLNFALKHKALKQTDDQTVIWSNVTSGNVVGVEVVLDNSRVGTLTIQTPHGTETIALSDIGREEMTFDYGKLGRRMRVFRLPQNNNHKGLAVKRRVALRHGDNPLYAVATLEDCNQAWASPIYLVRTT